MRTQGPGQSALLLLDVIHLLNERRIPYAIVGAFAASYHGVVRASLDADAVISLQSGLEGKELAQEFHRARFKATYRTGDLKDPIGAVINIEDGFHNRVDLLMNIRGMTDAALARAIDAEFMKTGIRVISLEDFIAMKVFAGGPQDVQDAIGALKVSSHRIKRPLLIELAQQYGKETSRRLQSLLKEHGQ